MKNIVASFSRFPVKLICCIAFGWASSFCLLKSIAISLHLSLKQRQSSKQPVVHSSPWPVAIFWMLSCYLIIFYW